MKLITFITESINQALDEMECTEEFKNKFLSKLIDAMHKYNAKNCKKDPKLSYTL